MFFRALARLEAKKRELQARLADTVLSPLPRCFVRAVFLLLPVDTRLRCGEVSRAWRALLVDTTLWSCLDLSISAGLSRFSTALFRTAVSKAGGQLRVLDVSGRNTSTLPIDTLRDALASNATTLKELRVELICRR